MSGLALAWRAASYYAPWAAVGLPVILAGSYAVGALIERRGGERRG